MRSDLEILWRFKSELEDLFAVSEGCFAGGVHSPVVCRQRNNGYTVCVTGKSPNTATSTAATERFPHCILILFLLSHKNLLSPQGDII